MVLDWPREQAQGLMMQGVTAAPAALAARTPGYGADTVGPCTPEDESMGVARRYPPIFNAPGMFAVSLPPLGHAVCRAIPID